MAHLEATPCDLLPMAKARGIPPLGRTPNALPAPQAPAYLPMAKARGITQDLVIECFWKMMKSLFQIRSRQLQGDGLYKALLIKVFPSVLALRIQGHSVFSQLTITQIMRKLSREHDFREFLATHFHAPFSTTYGI